MYKIHGNNSRRGNSASSLNGYIKRDSSKVIIALPTKNMIVKVFGKKAKWIWLH